MREEAAGPSPEGKKALDQKQFWGHVFTTWDDITSPDLQEIFGIDTELSWGRPWWFMRSRILALLDTQSRLAKSIQNL